MPSLSPRSAEPLATLQRHPDRAALAAAVVSDIATMICSHETREAVRFALGGGSTPAAIMPQLFARSDLPWQNIDLTVSDERQVPLSDPLSNGGRVERLRAGTVAGAARFVPLDRLEAGKLDIVWAGLGADGHTLSWFPGPDLDHALNGAGMVVSVRPDPLPAAAPVPRLTLTRRAVAAARMVIVVATGADKLAILEHPADLPIGMLLAAAPSARVHWAA